MNLLNVKKITKVFNPKTHAQITAVDGVSMKLDRGKVVLLMGPSGSGKTTLLTILGGLLTPTSGEILFEGVAIHNYSHNQLARFRRTSTGFIFQSFNLLENLTALENVIVGDMKGGNSLNEAKKLLFSLGLKNRIDTKPNDLSGGERQRVAIARALINKPDIILADEPTANLDSAIGHEVMHLLCNISCELGKGVIIASHDERIKDVAHQIIYMEDGLLKKTEKGKHDQTCQAKQHKY